MHFQGFTLFNHIHIVYIMCMIYIVVYIFIYLSYVIYECVENKVVSELTDDESIESV